MFIMPAFATYNLNANIPPQQCVFKNNIIENGSALLTKYLFVIDNCLDSDTPLRYNFYYYKNKDGYLQEIDNGQNVNKHLLQARNNFNFYETILPYGCSFILCSIVDSYGGVTNKT